MIFGLTGRKDMESRAIIETGKTRQYTGGWAKLNQLLLVHEGCMEWEKHGSFLIRKAFPQRSKAGRSAVFHLDKMIDEYDSEIQ